MELGTKGVNGHFLYSVGMKVSLLIETRLSNCDTSTGHGSGGYNPRGSQRYFNLILIAPIHICSGSLATILYYFQLSFIEIPLNPLCLVFDQQS